MLGKQLGAVQVHWPRMRASARVKILGPLDPDDKQSVVMARLVEVRRMSARLSVTRSRDLGEAVVIAPARVLADEGHQVWVVIDDQRGKALASTHDLAVLAVEDLLLAAVRLGLLAPERLRKTYEDLIPFGSGLPTWDASSLKRQFRDWRRAHVESAATSAP